MGQRVREGGVPRVDVDSGRESIGKTDASIDDVMADLFRRLRVIACGHSSFGPCFNTRTFPMLK
jgi:hypothetical protein